MSPAEPIKFDVHTRHRTDFVEITSQVADQVHRFARQAGVLTLFIPHTTAGITINENADPDVATDMMMFLDRLVPRNAGYRHTEGNADSHIKASLLGSSVRVILQDGHMMLGTWQGIYLCDFDGPRVRQVWLHIES